MKNIIKNAGFLILGLLFAIGPAGADNNDIPSRPIPPRLVNDFTGTLSQAEINKLEQKLVHFNDTTSTQIVVVLVPSLNGYDKAQYADMLGEKWGVGHKGKDNGLVVLIKPKQTGSPGQAFIATGYGLEGVVPDATAKRIVEEEMIPLFKENRYYEGIDRGTNTLMGLTAHEFTADDYMKRTESEPGVVGTIFIILFFIIFFRLIRRSRNIRHYGGRRGSSVPFWTSVFLANEMGRHSHGSWSDFSSGSGSFGGGSSFGGFGGGSFGGGGAGGSW